MAEIILSAIIIFDELFWRFRIFAFTLILGKKNRIGKALIDLKKTGFAIIPQYYPDGTLVFRRSGAYHKSEKVTSITTTSDSMKITTDQGDFLFNGVTSFIRKKKHGEETVHKTIIGTEMTAWTQTERDSLFASI